MSDSRFPGLPSRGSALVGLVVVAVLLAVGVYAGLRSPWGAKHAQVKAGVAVRANDENDRVMFDAYDGAQVDFGADSIWWESAGSRGDGDPPCLKEPLAKVDVEVGVMRIADPDGSWHQQAVWVRCL
jgi:hypothetical protein